MAEERERANALHGRAVSEAAAINSLPVEED
jgi:hypothetical protein